MSSPSVLKILGLYWPSVTSIYAMYTMMSYLTDVWDLSFTNAASVMNLFYGLILFCLFGFKFLADAFLGGFRLLLLSCFVFTSGLGLLWLSTPPVLSGATGACSEYKAECVGGVQKTLLYIALPLIALGISCHFLLLQNFIDDQKSKTEKKRELSKHGFLTFLLYFVPLAGVVAIPFIKPWSIKFAIPAICSLIATIIFLTGIPSYVKKGPQGRGRALESIPLILEIVPMSVMMVVPSLVLSIGNTYFLEQADMMRQTVFGIEIPAVLAIMPFYDAMKSVFDKCRSRSGSFSYFRMGASMFFMTLCCVVAAAVEKWRLNIAEKAGVIETDASVPLNMFWLLPQLLLLAAGDGLFRNCIPDFFRGRYSDELVDYVDKFALSLAGIGYMGGALSVYVVGKISESDGKMGWFQHSLNRSRLDNYYWTLAAMGAFNFVFFSFVAWICGPMIDSDGENDSDYEPVAEEDPQPADEVASKLTELLGYLY